MSASDEVDNAIGEATPTKKQLLAEKKQALEDAQGRYLVAKEMRDEDEMYAASGIIDSLKIIIDSIETELVVDREAEGFRAAQNRLTGIKREFLGGSVVTSIDKDEKLVVEKIAELEDAITRLNDRYSTSIQLRAEAAALADRFNLLGLVLPIIAPPASRDLAISLIRLPNTLAAGLSSHPYRPEEVCEHNLRTRRTYAEAANTPGGAIIEAAGLKPFPELTQPQKDFLAARQREKESERRALSGLPQMPVDERLPLGSL